jgi:hypothetical protein
MKLNMAELALLIEKNVRRPDGATIARDELARNTVQGWSLRTTFAFPTLGYLTSLEAGCGSDELLTAFLERERITHELSVSGIASPLQRFLDQSLLVDRK